MQSDSRHYYKYLDSYRFIAVMLVIITHWLPSYFGHMRLSKIGVDMFFVLSGFLISENLFRQKSKIKRGSSIWLAVKTFFVKRSFRIFPIYYLLLVLLCLVPVGILTANPEWFFLYATNYLVISTKMWPGMLSHLWSLAVEEQFYLVWPFVILFCPVRILKILLPGIIAASVAFIFLSFPKNSFQIFSLQSCLSTLCTGSVLAFAKYYSKDQFRAQKIDLFLLSTLGLVLLFWMDLPIPVYHVLTAGFSFILIKILVTRDSPFLDMLMANRWTTFLGRISYGLYLYHNITPWLLRILDGTETEYPVKWMKILPTIPLGWPLLFAYIIATMIVALTSWYLVEKPLLKIKENIHKSPTDIFNNGCEVPGNRSQKR